MKNTKWNGLKKFYSYNKHIKYTSMFEIFCFFILGILEMMPIMLLTGCIDLLSNGKAIFFGIWEITNQSMAIYLLIAVFFCWLLVELGEQQLRAQVRINATKYAKDLREKMQCSLVGFNKKLQPKLDTGDIINNVTRNIEGVSKIYTTPICEVISPFVKGISSLVYLFFIDYKIALCALVFLPFFIVLSSKMIKFSNKLNNDIKNSQSENNSYYMQVLNNFPLFSIFSSKKVEVDYYHFINNKIYSSEKKLANKFRLFWALMNLLKISVCIICLSLAFRNIQSGFLTVASLVLIYTYVKNTYQPVFSTNLILSNANMGSIELERIFNLIEQKEDCDYKKEAEISNIEFKNVYIKVGNFSLENFNAKFSKNHINYICGKSGCGKTLITSLLYCSKYKYSGDILINDIKHDGLSFENVSVAMQNAMVLDRSISENLNYPKFNRPMNAELLEVLNIDTEALSNSINKDNGFDTNNLSGGEKRKISLYRALNKESSVYILDEPTNDLDESTIKNLMKFLEKQKGKAVYIIITHNKNFVIDDSNTIMI